MVLNHMISAEVDEMASYSSLQLHTCSTVMLTLGEISGIERRAESLRFERMPPFFISALIGRTSKA